MIKMAQDAFGNYYPGFTVVFNANPVSNGGGSAATGFGTPENAVAGGLGDSYVDLDNGNFYVKTTGSGTNGWVLVSGGVAELSWVSGDPNGQINATLPAIAYDNAGRLWEKTGAGTNDTGWEQLIGPPL